MDQISERRLEPRRPCRKPIMVSLAYGIHGRGSFIDISNSGLLLRSEELFRRINPKRLSLLMHHELRIMLPSLVIEGQVVRFDAASCCLAASIRQVSNQPAWSGLA
ncbi:MAG: hypothetical protein BWY87_01713 [Deltaproteobacteria bacterium ADurb.Bin510]|nr:MAG: hypothetical protein BWY87_01713 [Deltaproteobacteria bacterium ADurb.Bin510]